MVIFYYYGIKVFQAEDIKEFYKLLQMQNPRSEGIRKPSLTQIVKVITRLSNIQCIEENSFEILEVDAIMYEHYKNEIQYGYEKGSI